MMADRELLNHNAELASNAEVVSDLDVHLVIIDSALKKDHFHYLQGLKDTTAGENPKCYYCYQRWGHSGSSGEVKLDGPMLQPEVEIAIANLFQESTGVEWGQLKPGDRALPGKYWVQQQAAPNELAKWEYYVSDGVYRKRPGWYPYDSAASVGVEDIYSQHVANARESRTSVRCVTVASGYFQYEIDLTKMTQMNTKTSMVRTIRRCLGSEGGSMEAPERKAMKKLACSRTAPSSMKKEMKNVATKAAMKKTMKVMKVMKALKKKSKVGSKSQVLSGKRLRTKGGIKADDLMKNKEGKVVSKKRNAIGLKAYANLAAWVDACKQARNELGLKGFVAVKKETEFYIRAKAILRGPMSGA